MRKSATPVPSTSRRSSAVAETIGQAIVQGKLRSGSELPTTRQIARAYGISLPTVQTVLGVLEDRDLIRCRPRQRAVVTAGAKLDAAKKTTVAVIRGTLSFNTEELQASWLSNILRYAEAPLHQQGMHQATFIYDTVNNRDHGLRHIPTSTEIAAQVMPKLDQCMDELAAVVFCGWDATMALSDELTRREVPWLTINRPRLGISNNYIMPDTSDAGQRLGLCMAHAGYQRVLLMSVDPNMVGKRTTDFFSGIFEGCLLSHQGPMPAIEHVACKWMDAESGRDKMLQYLDAHEPPHAVVGDDWLAIGAMQACQQRGLDVPRQVAVIGSLGMDVSAHCHPPLTAVRMPVKKLGEEMANRVAALRRGGASSLPGRKVPCELVVRDSMPLSREIWNSMERAEDENRKEAREPGEPIRSLT